MKKRVEKQELENFASKIISFLKQKEINTVALFGDLGAGKTSFVQAIGKILQIEDKILSPTFNIFKIYDIANNTSPWSKLYHIDAYRIEGESADPLGFKEIFSNKDNLVFIEWPENLREFLPEKMLKIKLKTIDENTREFSLSL